MNDSQKGGARLMKSEHKRRELAPLLAIFGILVGLALASLLTPEREFSPNENRYLQLKPSLTWTTLMDGTFTQKAKDYVADQIALRDRWMEASSLVQRAALRLEINDTWLGRDGRYFAKVTPDTFDSAQYEKNLAQVKDFFDANPDKDCRMMMVPTPAYMLRDDLPAKQKGFDLGIDDYMVKPIDVDELLLRIEALLRRARIEAEKRLVVGSTVLDAEERSAYVGGKEITLTVREFDLLYKLLSYPRRTFSRAQLMDEFWDGETSASLRAVDVYITRIRDKMSVSDDFKIMTVHGLGYKAVPNT